MVSVKISRFGKEKKEVEKKEKKKRKALPIFAVVAVLLSVVLLLFVSLGKVPDRASVEGFSYSLVTENETQREKFWKQFGFEAKLLSERDIYIPEKGEEFEKYNGLQLAQGLDLRGYGGFEAKEYAFELSRGDLEEPLFGIMVVYKGRVVALHFDKLMGEGVLGIQDVLKSSDFSTSS